MMDVVGLSKFNALGGRCQAFDSTLGKDAEIFRGASFIASKITIRVSAVSKMLVDGCERLRFKILDPASTFLLPADSHELDEVEPVLRELRARNIIVVEPIKHLDKEAIKKELYNTFYHFDGSLINDRFAAPNLSPSRMAEEGFAFIGNATDDSVQCYGDASHVLANWHRDDCPRAKHSSHFGSYYCKRFDQSVCLPFLLDKRGTNVTGQMYRLIDKESNSISCHRGVVLIHRDHPVRMLTLKTLELDIDALCLNKVEESLKKKEKDGLINDEYFALRERFLRVSHFSGLFRRFRRLREEYIAVLNGYKAKLQTEQQVAVAERTVASLLACPVNEEIKSVISALTGLEKARWQEEKQAGRPVHHNMDDGNNKHEPYDPQGRKSAEAMLAVLAEVYAVNHFRDAILNDLMSAGGLGCLYSDDYFISEMKDEVLMKLWEKGTDLTGVLASIANNLGDLTGPFLPGKKSNST